jgi:hypothetical protein
MTMTRSNQLAILGTVMSAWCLHPAGQAAGTSHSQWTLEPAPKIWTLQGFAESLDLSGIASSDGRRCLVASDELTAVQLGEIDAQAGVITAGPMVPLAAGQGKKKTEIDIEGVAAAPDGRSYYVTGSHGVGKKKGDVQAERYAVYKVPIDPETGVVRRDGIRRASLRPWFEQSPRFSEHLGRPLQQNGLNIEGLACVGERLYFALRGPNLDGNAFILETEAGPLFRGEEIQCVVHALPLGNGRGLRDLVACRDGFLLISGNASAEASKAFPVTEAREPDGRFQLGWWQPGKEPSVTWLGELPSAAGKAEALMVLGETDAHLDLLCLFDGAPEGGAVAYRLKRTPLVSTNEPR